MITIDGVNYYEVWQGTVGPFLVPESGEITKADGTTTIPISAMYSEAPIVCEHVPTENEEVVRLEDLNLTIEQLAVGELMQNTSGGVLTEGKIYTLPLALAQSGVTLGFLTPPYDVADDEMFRPIGYGRVAKLLIETGQVFTSGGPIYLSSIEAGTICSVAPAIIQVVGVCVNATPVNNRLTCIWCPQFASVIG